ncbi:hypothetical protein CCP2SC5_860003 [Azospirillaceae bacterium]
MSLISLVSSLPNGTQGNNRSEASSISSDGRYVVFESDANNLVAGDTNGQRDIFIKDTQTGTVTRISAASNGAEGNNQSFSPSVSADGRYVVFESDASNLVAGDTNGRRDVFLKDRQTGTITRVSTASNGAQGNDYSSSASISSNGRYITFRSRAGNLVAGDANEREDVFIKDINTGATTRVSAFVDGVEGNDDSSSSSVSSDGRYIAFESSASNLVSNDTNNKSDIFVKDRQTETITRVSVTSSGGQGNGLCSSPKISEDGRYVVFQSESQNLVAGDTNGVPDIFVKDMKTGTITRVSTASNGAEGNGYSSQPSISSDGRYIAFFSKASNLASGDTNASLDVFVKDMQTGTITRVSMSDNGVQGNYSSSYLSISSDGSYISFKSQADNLIAGANSYQVYKVQINSQASYFSNHAPVVVNPIVNQSIMEQQFLDFTIPSNTFNDQDSDSLSYSAQIVVNGVAQALPSWLSFNADTHTFNGLVPNDGPNLTIRVTVDDGRGGNVGADFTLATPANQAPVVVAQILVSSTANWAQGNSVSNSASISSDGRYVVFYSWANNFILGDTNNAMDVFVKDMQTGAIARVSTTLDGNQANGDSSHASLSSNSSYVVFESKSSNLVENDTNGKSDIFIKNVRTGEIARVNISASGQQGNNESSFPVVSSDGVLVAFQSVASNLVAGDTNGQSDVFVKNVQTGAITRVSSSSSGAQGNNASSSAVISSDGRFVAFQSSASNLVAGDTNGQSDVFIRDMETGAVTRVSVASNGDQGGGASSFASISSNGRYVAFESLSNNLVFGDTNDASDVFVKDMVTGVVSRVSTSTNGSQGNGGSWGPSISSDGRYVAFYSYARNLVSVDANGVMDIFIKDMQTGAISRISSATSGVQSNNSSFFPSISSDGSYVTFYSWASNLIPGVGGDQVYRVQINTQPSSVPNRVPVVVNSIETLSVNEQQSVNFMVPSDVFSDPDGDVLTYSAQMVVGGVAQALPAWLSFNAGARVFTGRVPNNTPDLLIRVVADDGRGGRVNTNFVIETPPANRAPVVLNALSDQSFTERESVGFTIPSNAFSDPDGDDLVYAAQMVVGGVAQDLPSWLRYTVNSRSFTGVVPDNTPNLTIRITARDGKGGSVSSNFTLATPASLVPIVVSQSVVGSATNRVAGNGVSGSSSLSSDGRYAAFFSWSNNFVAGDTNGAADIFVKDIQTETITRISSGLNGAQGNNGSFSPTISSDGRYVAFESRAGNLVTGDTNGASDIFFKDVQSGSISRISSGLNGAQGNGGSFSSSMSLNGRYVAFCSDASNFVTGDTNRIVDIFRKDVLTGSIARVNVTASGVQADSASSSPSISGDGRYVAFESRAKNLVESDTNEQADIFVRDMQDGTITRVSLTNSGLESNNASSSCVISSDGRYVAFESQANNLVIDDTNGISDVFVKDMRTGAVVRVSTGSYGVQGNGGSFSPSISSDGRYIAFESFADNLVENDANGSLDVFVKDIQERTIKKLTITGSGSLPNDYRYSPSISADGRYVSFNYYAHNQVSGVGGDQIYRVQINDQPSSFLNHVPAVANAIPNQSATEQQSINFTIASDVFRDQDSDVLSYSAQIVNNGVAQALPSWLNFNAGARVFTGRVPNLTPDLTIRVTANDGRGGIAVADFILATPAAMISDTIANLFPSGVISSRVLPGVNVSVLGSATIAQLKTIDSTNGIGRTTTASIRDAVENLMPYEETSIFIVSGTNVVVTNAATISQLVDIDSANGSGTTTATSITDTVENLFSYGYVSSFITQNVNVSVTNTARVSQISEIDARNGSGALTYSSLMDSADNLFASSFVKAGINVIIDGAATANQIAVIDNKNGSGTLSWRASETTDFSAMAAVNDLTLLGSGNINGTGNAKNNTMFGNSGVNRLSGGVGNDTLVGGNGGDTLVGGAGNDVFRYLFSSEGGDTITDFVRGADKIQIVSPNFGNISISQLSSGAAFVSNATGSAVGSLSQLIFNTSNGNLYYDADGVGSSSSVLLASLNVRTFGASDILVSTT